MKAHVLATHRAIWCGLLFVVQTSMLSASNLALKLAFDASRFLEVPTIRASELGTNFTMEAWAFFPEDFVNPDPAQYRWIVLASRASDGGTGVRLGQEGKFYILQIRVSETQLVTARSASRVHLGIWVHLAGVWDGSRASLYVNGRLAAQDGISGAATALPPGDGNLLVGKEGLAAAENPWPGQIDEIRIWRRSLSQEELTQGMRKRLAGNETGLMGYWGFDQGDGRDSSINGNNGAVHGSVQFVERPTASITPLESPLFSADQPFEFQLDATTGYGLSIETSTDFSSWQRLNENYRIETNANGTLKFLDLRSSTTGNRFYRAVLNAPPD